MHQQPPSLCHCEAASPPWQSPPCQLHVPTRQHKQPPFQCHCEPRTPFPGRGSLLLDQDSFWTDAFAWIPDPNPLETGFFDQTLNSFMGFGIASRVGARFQTCPYQSCSKNKTQPPEDPVRSPNLSLGRKHLQCYQKIFNARNEAL
jgi:hypothetical protein